VRYYHPFRTTGTSTKDACPIALLSSQLAGASINLPRGFLSVKIEYLATSSLKVVLVNLRKSLLFGSTSVPQFFEEKPARRFKCHNNYFVLPQLVVYQEKLEEFIGVERKMRRLSLAS
jgi:hypothetical protein